MKDYRTAGLNVFIPHYRSDDPRGPQGPALHLYPSDAGPGPLTQDEMDQLPDKVLDQIACIFREANGNDQTTRLCGGCLITLLGNLMVAFAARVVHANGQPDFDGAITALFSLHEHARRIAQQVHAHQRRTRCGRTGRRCPGYRLRRSGRFGLAVQPPPDWAGWAWVPTPLPFSSYEPCRGSYEANEPLRVGRLARPRLA
jgi:hypothetical protein